MTFATKFPGRARDDGVDHGERPAAGGFVLVVARCRSPQRRDVQPGAGSGELPIGGRDALERVATGDADGVTRQPVGELAYREHGEVAAEAGEAVDVLVQRRRGDIDTIRQCRQREPIEPDLVDQPARFGHDPFLRQTLPGHQRLPRLSDQPIVPTETNNRGSDTNAAMAMVGSSTT